MWELYEELSSPAAVRELRLPEGLSVEYKSRVPRTESLAKDCCAFANTIGGMVIIGVEDPPQEGAAPTAFPGVPAEPDPIRSVDGMLSNSIVPRIEYESRPVFFLGDDGEERCYVALWVEPGGELHQVSLEDVGTCYRRVGRHSVPMGPEEIRQRVEMISRSSHRLENRIEEQLSKIGGDQAFVYTVVAPDTPFARPLSATPQILASGRK
jgi:predicted HTH transcriptional regulator